MRLYEESLQLLNMRKNELRRNDYNIVYLGDSWVTINKDPFLHEIEDKASIAFVSHVHAYDTAKIEGTRFVLSGCAGVPQNVNQLNHIVVVNVKNEGGKSRIRFKKVPVGWT